MLHRLAIALLSTAAIMPGAWGSPEATQSPHGALSIECQRCHTAFGWSVLRDTLLFSHDHTSFTLVGAHQTTRCKSCHTNLEFAAADTNCAVCHIDPHRGQVGSDCRQCHTPQNWRNHDDMLGMHSTRGFPLTGVHANVDCSSCHLEQEPLTFTRISAECRSCHSEDFNRAANPDHNLAGFSMNCEQCHRTPARAWTEVDYTHTNAFPLMGGHATPTCNTCHAEQYVETPNQCITCHESDYADAEDPDHVGSNFDQDCAICHTVLAWTPANIAHSLTQFPLTGAHVEVQCNDCHQEQFTGTTSECGICHNAAFTTAEDPNHVTAGFSMECATCHTTDAWAPATIDHDLTDFPLTGAHTTVGCENCHASGYTGTLSECITCHGSDFTAADDPDHEGGAFDQDCAICHSTTAWEPAEWDHDDTEFPLTGAHTSVTCSNCHSDGYTGTSTACMSCHTIDYTSVTEPNHVLAEFEDDCRLCHTTAAWSPADWTHDQTGFILTGAHTSLTCSGCHSTGFTGTQTACVACHESAYLETPDPNHVAAGFSTACQQCHTPNGWTPATLDHNLTSFPLTGAHEATTCMSCHTAGYTGTPMQCFSCHESEFTSVVDPSHVLGNFDHDCAVCHSTDAWIPADWDHNLTQFPLTGAHEVVTCNSCHTNGYAGTPMECYACHESNYLGVSDPDHIAAGFPIECQQCHTTTGWRPANLNHDLTDFPLTGAHQGVSCENCHTSGYTGTSQECFACHESDYASTTDPDHALGHFDHDCAQCHTTNGWTPSDFNHSTTQFELTGAHQQVTCSGCHMIGFVGTPMACVACHESDYTTVVDPNHVSAGFSTVCQDCHTTEAWQPVELDHDVTSFPLTGAHTSVSCVGCHTTGFTGTPSECFACHEIDYMTVVDPNHVTAGFETACVNCHSTAGWTPADLDHDLTGFSLTGAHASIECSSCHASGFTGTSSECYGCHETDFVSTEEPDHVDADFDHVCTVCHTTSGWTPADWSHDQTLFPLTGAHETVTCNTCHGSGYAGTSMECIACHVEDYESTTEPNHLLTSFGEDCALCHTTTAWEPADWDHKQTQFPLTGAHQTTTCNSCHASGYAGTPMACMACHEPDYNGANDPRHELPVFGHDCAECHTTTSWEPATWDHDVTQFPLTGAHASTSCASCHSNGYSGTPTDCYSCHSNDYVGVGDPRHQVPEFSHNCVACHNTSTWQPSGWNHNQTQFTLTGAHQSITCYSCHASSYAGTPMECFACHETDYASTIDPVHTLPAFSHNCAVCHTTAAWEPADWDHNLTQFPLSGAHVAVSCNNCHASGYTGTPTDCFACHESNYTGVVDPSHELPVFGHDCTECHTTSAWLPATWDHNTTQFPLTGAHQTTTCSSCHIVGYAGTPMECIACHDNDYNTAIDPDHVGSGFPTQCDVCHTTGAWEPAGIDHDLTAFPLTGAHQAVSCNNCHIDGFTGTPTDCYGCHETDYSGVSDPVHELPVFSHACTDCHTTMAWNPATWDHNDTQFPLTGAHQTPTCASCHADGYTGTPLECLACHANDYNSAVDPDHVGGGFPTQCDACHTTVAWEPAGIDHDQTSFPLTGAHQAVSCASCHISGYTETPTDCFACHELAYIAVIDPNHVQSDFDHDCTICHTTSAWTPADVDHDQTEFPLTGAHQSVACISCHAAGYTGTPFLCLACHESDYNGASPNHLSAGFPAECELCHTTNAWTPANWDHDALYFSIYSGKHRDKWDDCSDCHVNPSNFATFECIFCHEHRQSTMDDKHKEENGYQYNSIACLNCHPDGRED